jgi:hypothetical protein
MLRFACSEVKKDARSEQSTELGAVSVLSPKELYPVKFITKRAVSFVVHTQKSCMLCSTITQIDVSCKVPKWLYPVQSITKRVVACAVLSATVLNPLQYYHQKMCILCSLSQK